MTGSCHTITQQLNYISLQRYINNILCLEENCFGMISDIIWEGFVIDYVAPWKYSQQSAQKIKQLREWVMLQVSDPDMGARIVLLWIVNACVAWLQQKVLLCYCLQHLDIVPWDGSWEDSVKKIADNRGMISKEIAGELCCSPTPPSATQNLAVSLLHAFVWSCLVSLKIWVI